MHRWIDLKRQLDAHEWDHRDEVSELIATLSVKLRNQGVGDQTFAINHLLRVLGWSHSTPSDASARGAEASGRARTVCWRAS